MIKKTRAHFDSAMIKNSGKCALTDLQNRNLSQLSKINDNVLYEKLVQVETESLTCSISQWDHISEPKNDLQAQEIVDTINLQVPKLDGLRKQLNEYSIRYRNPGLIYKNDRSLSQKEKQAKITEVTELVHDNLLFLQSQYELEMAKIPLSKHGPVQSFVESKLSSPFGKLQKANLSEFIDLAKNMKTKIQYEKDELLLSSKTNSLSSAQEKKLVLNQENIALLIQRDPEMATSAFSLQCRMDQRIKGQIGLEIGLGLLSTVVTGGAILLARASRLALVARNAEMVTSTLNLSEVLSSTGATVGSVTAFAIVIDRCSMDAKAIKASCDINLSKIKNDQQLVNCLLAATLAYAPKGLPKAKKWLDSELIEK